MKKMLLGLGIFFLFLTNTKAAASACSYKDQIALNQKAANIKRGYEIVTQIYEGDEGDVEVDTFRVSIYNLSEEFYAVITNSKNQDEKIINYSDVVDGIATFDWDDIEDMTTFNIKIYTSDKSLCPDELYKTFLLTTPRYNPFYELNICRDIPEYSLCQKYVTFSAMPERDFLERAEGYMEGNGEEEEELEVSNETFMDKVLNFIKKYKWILIGIVLVGGATGCYFIIRKSKKQRKLEI